MKASPPPPPDSPVTRRSQFDWTRESGLGDVFVKRLEVHVKKKKRRKQAIKAGAAVIALGLFLAFYAFPTLRHTHSLSTPLASRQAHDLDDGSHAELNAGTELATDFRYGRRTVRLRKGEAFFSVAPDPTRPFLVETPAGLVRVLGTSFNLRMESPHSIEVTLLNGSVLIDGQAKALQPGEQFRTDAPAVRVLGPADLDNITAWRKGQFAFDGLTLQQVATRLAAFHGTTINVDPSVAHLEPGGTFALDDLPKLLRTLETALPVKVLTTDSAHFRIVGR